MTEYIFWGVLTLLTVWAVMSYNTLILFRNQVKNAWHQIDVQLKRRYDLIPNLVEVVKDYMSFEQETLKQVIEARQMAMTAKGRKAQAEAEGMLTASLRSLFAVAENYPNLKTDETVSRLQEELASTENRISFARQFYNDTVMQYNTKLQTVPTNLVAGFFRFTAEEFFEVPAGHKTAVKVDLR
jgi:LemA protein